MIQKEYYVRDEEVSLKYTESYIVYILIYVFFISQFYLLDDKFMFWYFTVL